MKHIAPLLLSAAAMLLLSGCGKKQESSAVTDTSSATTTTATTASAVMTTEPASDPPVQTIPTLAAEPEETTARTDATTYEIDTTTLTTETTVSVEVTIDKDGSYTTKDDVALYIYTYGELPHNFITKQDAQALGWEGGSLEPYAPGCCIGGSRFGNYEGNLPTKKGRTYTECDIDTLGKKSRGAKRIVFSNDGLIYYTEDHYSTFELLYGEVS